MKKNKILSIVFFLLFMFSMFFSPLSFIRIPGASATTRTVGTGATYATIQDAINASSNGDTINVWAGTYTECIIVNKSVSVIGNSSSNTTIDGGCRIEPVINITVDNVHISGLNITNTNPKYVFEDDYLIQETADSTNMVGAGQDGDWDTSESISQDYYINYTIPPGTGFDATNIYWNVKDEGYGYYTMNIPAEVFLENQVSIKISPDSDFKVYVYYSGQYNEMPDYLGTNPFYEDSIQWRMNQPAILFYWCNNTNISDCMIYNNPSVANVGTDSNGLHPANYLTFYNNTIYSESSGCIIVGDNFSFIKNEVFQVLPMIDYYFGNDSLFYDNYFYDYQDEEESVIYISGEGIFQTIWLHNTTIRKNTFEGYFYRSIELQYVDGFNISDNTFIGYYATYDIDFEPARNGTIYNNTIDCYRNAIYMTYEDIEIDEENAAENTLPAECQDGNYDTEADLTEYVYYYINYTKPAGTYSDVYWVVKDSSGGATQNFDLAVVNYDPETIYLRMAYADGYMYYEGFGPEGYEGIFSWSVADGSFYEEGMEFYVVEPSSNVTVSKNIITLEDYNGIRLGSLSHDIFIENNTITGSGGFVYDGIAAEDSYNIFIKNNTIMIDEDGMYIIAGHDFIIINNTIEVVDYGIEIDDDTQTVLIENNTITADPSIDVNGDGMTISNNIISGSSPYDFDANNHWNVSKTLGTNIIGGPYLGGNYWSNYDGSDADGDGFGDTPREIPGDSGSSYDYYPLVFYVPPSTDIRAPTNGAATYNGTNGVLSITWTKGAFSTNSVLVMKNSSQPASPSDGLVLQNSSSTSYDFVIYDNQANFTVFAYNSTTHEWNYTGLNITYNLTETSTVVDFSDEFVIPATVGNVASDNFNDSYIIMLYANWTSSEEIVCAARVNEDNNITRITDEIVYSGEYTEPSDIITLNQTDFVISYKDLVTDEYCRVRVGRFADNDITWVTDETVIFSTSAYSGPRLTKLTETTFAIGMQSGGYQFVGVIISDGINIYSSEGVGENYYIYSILGLNETDFITIGYSDFDGHYKFGFFHFSGTSVEIVNYESHGELDGLDYNTRLSYLSDSNFLVGMSISGVPRVSVYHIAVDYSFSEIGYVLVDLKGIDLQSFAVTSLSEDTFSLFCILSEPIGEDELFSNYMYIGAIEIIGIGDELTATISVINESEYVPSDFADLLDFNFIYNMSETSLIVTFRTNDTSDWALLYIVFSIGIGEGGSIPSGVTTNASSIISETAALLHGYLNNSGGGQCEYQFEYDIDSGAPYASSTAWTGWILSGTEFSKTALALTKGELYYFRAGCRNFFGSDNGSELMFLTKPDASSSLNMVRAGETGTSVTWAKGDGADRTIVLRRNDSYPNGINDSSAILLYNGTGTNCSDSNLTIGDTYYYRAWSYCSEEGLFQFSDSYDEKYIKIGEPGSGGGNDPQPPGEQGGGGLAPFLQGMDMMVLAAVLIMTAMTVGSLYGVRRFSVRVRNCR